jgi:hypothetical protein
MRHTEAKVASSIAVWAGIRSMGSARVQDQAVMNGFGTRRATGGCRSPSAEDRIRGGYENSAYRPDEIV